MNRPPATQRVRWRESFGAKVATAVLGTVALLLATTLLIVRFEMRLQVGEVVDDATERSRAAFAEIVALQEERLSDILNPITGSRRTVAALEAALDAGDPDLLRQEVGYGLELVDAGEIGLMLFTDADGVPVLTVVDGETLNTRDPANLQSMIDHVVIGGFGNLISFRLVNSPPLPDRDQGAGVGHPLHRDGRLRHQGRRCCRCPTRPLRRGRSLLGR